MTGVIDNALALAASGLPTFPCCPADKAPLVAHGFHDATVDPDRLCGWWRRWPWALPAVPTGAPSGLWVADLDVDEETGETRGEISFAALALPWPAYCIRTPSGGWHLPYRWKPGLPRCSTNQPPGIDVRSEGGYVCAWEPAALIAAAQSNSLPYPPAALVTAVAPPVPARSVCTFTAPASVDRWSAAALVGELRAVAGAPKGSRNHQLNRSSFKLGQLVAGGFLELNHVSAELHRAAVAAGLGEKETLATLRSGISAGTQHPRQRRARP